MPFIFAIFSRLIGIGLFLVGGFVVLTKLLGGAKSARNTKNSGADPLEEYLMPKANSGKNEKALFDARARFESEMRLTRDKAREQQKRFKRIDGAWKFVSLGAGLLAGGLAMETTSEPLGPIGLGILVAALIGWIGSIINNYINNKAIANSAIIVPPREMISAPTIATDGLANGRSELVNSVLNEAATALNKLDAAIPKLRHTASIASVSQIVITGKRIMNNVAANPERFAIAQRLFTYYCPQSVGVAEALAGLENEGVLDIERISSTQSVLQKLSILFEKTELELKADDNKSLDIDLKLLDQSLQADLTSV